MNDDKAPIGVICFDWGGVLLRICRGFAEGCQAAGLEMRDGATDPELYDLRREHSALFQVGQISQLEFFNAVSESFGGLYSPEEIEKIHDAWLIEEYHGVDELVAGLHDAGLATALLSNTNDRHWERRLADFPVAGSLTHQHASHLLGIAKPKAAIFEAFERQTGFAGAQIVFFDDLKDNVEAATKLGWRAVQIDHTGDTASQMTEALFDFGVLD